MADENKQRTAITLCAILRTQTTLPLLVLQCHTRIVSYPSTVRPSIYVIEGSPAAENGKVERRFLEYQLQRNSE